MRRGSTKLKPGEHFFKSLINGEKCKHRHHYAREARECGYAREKKIYWEHPHVVQDHLGKALTSEEQRAADKVIEAAEYQTRLDDRMRQIRELEAQDREIRHRLEPWRR